MAIYADVALCLSSKGEEELQNYLEKAIPSPGLKEFQEFILSSDHSEQKKGDVLRLWLRTNWDSGYPSMQFLDRFVNGHAEEARLTGLFHSDYGPVVINEGSYIDAFDLALVLDHKLTFAGSDGKIRSSTEIQMREHRLPHQ